MAKLQRECRVMGGVFRVITWLARGQDPEMVISTIDNGLEKVKALEAKLTDFHDSPFNQINQCAGRREVVVDDETFRLIEKSIEISMETQGAFDISYASVGRLWRKARQEGILPQPDKVEYSRQFVDYRKIILNRQQSTVFLPHPQMAIGLGGIGKGYAVDSLYDFLLARGLVNFLVDGSGDIRVHSERGAPRAWRLNIRNPFSEDERKSMGVIQLSHGAVATSGDYINYVKTTNMPGRRYHHIIDPGTGAPTREIASCTIMADTALEADTQATAVIVMSVSRGLDYLNRTLRTGVIVDGKGNVYLSSSAMKKMEKANLCVTSL